MTNALISSGLSSTGLEYILGGPRSELLVLVLSGWSCDFVAGDNAWEAATGTSCGVLEGARAESRRFGLDDFGVGRRFGPEGDLVGEVERPEMCEGTPELELRNVE